MKKNIFFIVISCIFAFHFFMTALYVLPFNPISHKLNKTVNSYINPFFTQNWQLFAPDPLSNAIYVYVQVKDKQGEESKWIDISTPLYEANHANRFSPVNMLVRLGTGAYLQSVHVDPTSYKIEQKMNAKSDNNTKENQVKELTNYQRDGIQKLYNLGLYHAKNYFDEKSIDMIRIRVESEHPIPFSQRNNNAYEQEMSYITQEWISVSVLKGAI
ncbi:DUF5819 family protein [Viridibacillus sp. NPDC093762]|uniref:DUF5819 family protein n=1 Tax=Viridibacillus sp. NPDC093762 TaxID=3390720 RepID=UPI003CFE3E17